MPSYANNLPKTRLRYRLCSWTPGGHISFWAQQGTRLAMASSAPASPKVGPSILPCLSLAKPLALSKPEAWCGPCEVACHLLGSWTFLIDENAFWDACCWMLSPPCRHHRACLCTLIYCNVTSITVIWEHCAILVCCSTWHWYREHDCN